jgi:hypothetical protein
VSCEYVAGGVANECALGVVGVKKSDSLADPVGAGFHPLRVVIISGNDCADVTGEQVVSEVRGDRCAGAETIHRMTASSRSK